MGSKLHNSGGQIAPDARADRRSRWVSSSLLELRYSWSAPSIASDALSRSRGNQVMPLQQYHSSSASREGSGSVASQACLTSPRPVFQYDLTSVSASTALPARPDSAKRKVCTLSSSQNDAPCSTWHSNLDKARGYHGSILCRSLLGSIHVAMGRRRGCWSFLPCASVYGLSIYAATTITPCRPFHFL